MSHPRTLLDFVGLWESHGLLRRVLADVDAAGELGAVIERLNEKKRPSPVVLFERVNGADVPVITNQFASLDALLVALGAASIDEVVERFTRFIAPATFGNWWRAAREVRSGIADQVVEPVEVRQPEVRQVVHLGADIDLSQWPIPTLGTGESAPTIHGAQVTFPTWDEVGDSLREVVQQVPLQVVAERQLAMMWEEDGVLAQAWRKHAMRGLAFPVAVALGGDPLLRVLTEFELPAGWDPYVLAAVLRGEQLRVGRARTVDLRVPADAEVVIEGIIRPDATVVEAGPVLLAGGVPSPRVQRPILELTAVTHRVRPLFPVGIPSAVRGDYEMISHLWERCLSRVMPMFFPEVVDLAFPEMGRVRNCAIVAIRKRNAEHPRQFLHLLWGLGWPVVPKSIVVIDADIDPHDGEAVATRLTHCCNYDEDLVFSKRGRFLSDEHCTNHGSTVMIGIDATRKRRRVAQTRDASRVLVEQRWSEYQLD